MRPLLLTLVFPTFMLGGCVEDSLDPSLSDDGVDEQLDEVLTDDGRYAVHFMAENAPFAAGAESELGLHITAAGLGVVGADVRVTPWMPTMDHGIETAPIVTEEEDGMYRATWTFPMSGLWELDVEIDGSEGADAVTVSYEVE